MTRKERTDKLLELAKMAKDVEVVSNLTICGGVHRARFYLDDNTLFVASAHPYSHKELRPFLAFCLYYATKRIDSINFKFDFLLRNSGDPYLMEFFRSLEIPFYTKKQNSFAIDGLFDSWLILNTKIHAK